MASLQQKHDRAMACLATILKILDAMKRCSCLDPFPDDCHEKPWERALAEARALVKDWKVTKAAN